MMPDQLDQIRRNLRHAEGIGLDESVARHYRQDVPKLIAAYEAMVYEHAATVDAEWGCSHNVVELRAGGRAPEYDGDTFAPCPEDCPGMEVVRERLLGVD